MKPYTLTVKTESGKEFSFTTLVDPKYVEEWRAEGIEINELLNVIPEWVVDLGLMRPYIFFQDLLRLPTRLFKWL